MAKKKKGSLLKKLGVLLVVLVVVTGVAFGVMYAMQGVNKSPPHLVQEKNAQLEALDKLHAQRKTATDQYNPTERESGPRDTGHKGVGLFIKNVFFRIVGGIGFNVNKLSALLIPTDPPKPVIMDDPDSFIFKPLNGSIVMPPKALAATFNQYIAQYPGTPMRNISVKTRPGQLVVDGEVSKVSGVWLPFHMEGPLKLKEGHLLVFNPKKIEIEGIGQKGLLNLVNITLSNLLEVEPGGTKITGNDITLDLNYSLPPPQLEAHVSKMSVDKAGVHLTFATDHNPDFPEPVVASDSYALLEGGDVKTFRILLTDVRLQLVAADGGKLDTSLYNYRDQIIAGSFKATPTGAFVASLGPQSAVDYAPPAQPEKQ